LLPVLRRQVAFTPSPVAASAGPIRAFTNCAKAILCWRINWYHRLEAGASGGGISGGLAASRRLDCQHDAHKKKD
jgi:hypothetical protein